MHFIWNCCYFIGFRYISHGAGVISWVLDTFRIGTGAISVGVKILKISGTVNLQLGSIYADTAVHISRVSQNPSDASLCLKDTGPANATFAAGFKADLAAEILKGSFQIDVKIFGIK